MANLGHDGHLVRSVVLVVGPSNPLSGLPRAPTRLFHQISMEQSLTAPLPGKLKRAQTSDTLDTHDARASTVSSGLANLYEEDSDSDHEGRMMHVSTRRLESLPEVPSDDTNGGASTSDQGNSTPSGGADAPPDSTAAPSVGAPMDSDSKAVEPAAKPGPDSGNGHGGGGGATSGANGAAGGIASGTRRSNRRLAAIHLQTAGSNGSSRSIGSARSLRAGDSATGRGAKPRAGPVVGYSSPLSGDDATPKAGTPGAPVAGGRVASLSIDSAGALRQVPRPKSRGRGSAIRAAHLADIRAASPQVAPKAPPKKTFSARQISALKEMDKTEQSAVAGAALLQFATTMGGVLVEETFRYDLHRINTREELIAAYDRLFVRIRKHNAHAYVQGVAWVPGGGCVCCTATVLMCCGRATGTTRHTRRRPRFGVGEPAPWRSGSTIRIDLAHDHDPAAFRLRSVTRATFTRQCCGSSHVPCVALLPRCAPGCAGTTRARLGG